MNWFWDRLKAMHWAAKLFSVVFLLHAGVLLAQAYQLKHLKVPAFSELRLAEGKLIFVKQGKDWLTGVAHQDGTRELFSCQLPGGDKRKSCFFKDVREKYKLENEPKVVIWWYPIKVPLEDKIYPYIFQIQLGDSAKPFSYKFTDGREIVFSYSARSDFAFEKTHGIRTKVGLAIMYVFGVVVVFLWESFKYSTRRG